MSIAEFYVENCIDPDDSDALGAFLASHRDESDNEDDYSQDDDDHEQKMPRSIEYRQLEIFTDLATDRLDAGTAYKDSNEIVATSKVGASFNDSSKDNTVFNGAALKGEEETAKGITASTSAARSTASSSKRQKVEKLTHSFVVSVFAKGDTGGCYIIHPKVVGVFATKELAVAQIPTFKRLQPGCCEETFGKILDDLESYHRFGCKFTDNRSNPPDNGILWKIEYLGGELDEIRIEKFPLVDN
jgi:hypothetical protein